jgi:hypothetical protein
VVTILGDEGVKAVVDCLVLEQEEHKLPLTTKAKTLGETEAEKERLGGVLFGGK